MESATEKKPDDEVYFDRKTFLTLSGQMHLEAMCFRLGSVYNFGPVFRYVTQINRMISSNFNKLTFHLNNEFTFQSGKFNFDHSHE